jgi:hypothetical protein
MPYIIKRKSDGLYMKRNRDFTKQFNEARVFGRSCDAINATSTWRLSSAKGFYEVVEVDIILL